MKTLDAYVIAAAITVFALTGCAGATDLSNSGGTAAVARDEVEAQAASPAGQIDLSTVANVYALANPGSPVLGGGIDGLGYAYAENLSGSSITWNGATFNLGAPGVKNGVRQTTLTLPGGNYASLMVLATGVNGSWPSQTFVVSYTDGTQASFVQSLSDWHVPQSYAGESTAFTFAYRITSTGATASGPFYLYGYSFTLDSSKTVQSLTLPNNSHIVVLAVDLIASTLPAAATPTLSPAPGTYSTAQSVTLADTTPGATIYYTTDGTAPTTSSAKYSTLIPVATSTTIEAIAVASGYANSAVATGTYTITSGTVTPVNVGLSAVASVYALVNAGSPVLGGGIDGLGYAYAENLSGSSITWNGATFTLGAPGVKNGVTSTTVMLPAGAYSSLMVLATGVNGSWPSQTFVVNYTDGTQSSFVQSLSDWHNPQSYPGESKAFTFAYRVTSTGATGTGPFYLYGYSFALNSSKTVQSLTLPNNTHIVVLAVDLTASTLPAAATPTLSPTPGTYSTAQSVTLADTTPGATIYYTTDGTAPTTSSAKYSTPIPVATSTTIEAIAVASGYANSAVATGTYTITSGTVTPVNVGLSAVASVYALVNAGSPVLGGGIDGLGYAYAENLSGTSITWSGAKFNLGAPGVRNGVSQTTVTLPAGNYSSLMLLATGVNGSWPNQTFVVNYTDGTQSSFVQSLSDWYTPQSYPGESTAFSYAYRVNSTGGTATGPFYLYGYSFALNSGKTVQSLTLPNNAHIVVLAIDLIPVSPTVACSPLTYGAIGDGTTDNTNAIQSAVNACASQGGGTVELSVVGSNSTYLTGPFTLMSHVHLQIDAGVVLQAIHTHSRYVPAYINWVYRPDEALISANGATDVAILGSGVIDGAGDQPDPDDGGQTWYQLEPMETTANPSLRPWMLEFYQCDHVTITGVTLRNSPYWNQALRFSSTVTESGVTIFAAQGPNTDGVDLVGVTNATLSNLNISVIDDDIAIKSGLPISTSDPYYSKEIGLPQMPTSNVQITNITATNGAGIAVGSEAVNGVNNVTIDGVTLTNTSIGFRIKSARDRGGPIYNISVNHLTMNVTDFSYPRRPLVIDSYYVLIGPDSWGAAQPLTATTPYIHDITVQNFAATNANAQSYVQGLPESCIHNLTLNAVSIQTTTSLGIELHHVTGTFTNVTSTPPPPFVVDQNVDVTTAGTTPAITNTPPGSGQIACSAQSIPP